MLKAHSDWLLKLRIFFAFHLIPPVICQEIEKLKLKNEALSLAAFRVVDVVAQFVHWELWFHGFNAVFFFLKKMFLNSKCLKCMLIIHVLRWT